MPQQDFDENWADPHNRSSSPVGDLLWYRLFTLVCSSERKHYEL
jgi:hypothetical protein